MSEQNKQEGFDCYMNDGPEIRQWFKDQWAAWPSRVHDARTTNISFLYGGVKAYRQIHKKDPVCSPSFKSNFRYLE